MTKPKELSFKEKVYRWHWKFRPFWTTKLFWVMLDDGYVGPQWLRNIQRNHPVNLKRELTFLQMNYDTVHAAWLKLLNAKIKREAGKWPSECEY